MTKRAKYSFTPKSFHDGTPWIVLEPLWENLPVLSQGLLGFDLPAGTSHERAKEIAEFLNDNIVNVSYTNL